MQPTPINIRRLAATLAIAGTAFVATAATAPSPATAGEFTIADVMNVTWIRAGRDFVGLDYEPYPNVRRWLGEIEARPAIKKALALKP